MTTTDLKRSWLGKVTCHRKPAAMDSNQKSLLFTGKKSFIYVSYSA
jgi:hypothetical protein